VVTGRFLNLEPGRGFTVAGRSEPPRTITLDATGTEKRVG